MCDVFLTGGSRFLDSFVVLLKKMLVGMIDKATFVSQQKFTGVDCDYAIWLEQVRCDAVFFVLGRLMFPCAC